MANTTHILAARPESYVAGEIQDLQLWKQRNPQQAFRLKLYRYLRKQPNNTPLNYSVIAREFSVTRASLHRALDWLQLNHFIQVIGDEAHQAILVGMVPAPQQFKTLGHGVTTWVSKEHLPYPVWVEPSAGELTTLFYMYRNTPQLLAFYRYLRIQPDVTPFIRARVAGTFGVSLETVTGWVQTLVRDGLLREDPKEYALELVSPGEMVPKKEDEMAIDVMLHGPAAIPDLAVTEERLDGRKSRADQITLLLEFWEDARKAYFGKRGMPAKRSATVDTEKRYARLLLNDADAESYMPLIAYYVFWCADDDSVRKYGHSFSTFYYQIDRFRNDFARRQYTEFGEDIRRNGLESKWGHVVERFEQTFADRLASKFPEGFVHMWEKLGQVAHPETGEFLDVEFEWDQIPHSMLSRAFSLLTDEQKAVRIPLLSPEERQVLEKELTPTT